MSFVHLCSFLLSLLVPLAMASEATVIRYCDRKEDYVVKVKDVDISPYPVVPGQPVSFAIKASTARGLSGGLVEIRVLYFGVPVHTETRDICDSVTCPIAAGDFVLTHTQTLPALTPPGFYTLRITMSENETEQLTCINFTFRIKIRISLPPYKGFYT